MLRNTIIFASLIAVVTIFLSGMMSGPGREVATTNVNATSPAPAAAYEQRSSRGDDYRSMVISAGPGGHYRVQATINGQSAELLVDTGASFVALSRKDAEHVGIDLASLNYRGKVMTANGSVRFAPVTLHYLEIGDIVVNNVEAAVVDADMPTSLLGMSFLNRLSGFEVRDRQLVLRY